MMLHPRSLLLLLALAPLLMCAALAQDNGWLEQDPALYGSTEDVITDDEARQLLLKLVNAERRKHGLKPLLADPQADELATDRADETADSMSVSHYDTDGRKIEQRFNSLGRTDHATENLLLLEVQLPLCLTPQLVARLHALWMDKPGHRANMLDPAHTSMGSGFRVIAGENGAASITTAAQVFVNDWGDCDRLPETINLGAHQSLSGFLAPGRSHLVGISIGREDVSDSTSPGDPLHYAMPEPTVVYVEPGAKYPPASGSPYLIHNVDYNEQTGYFSVELYFPRHWEGSRVYITVEAQVGDGPRFPAMTQVLETRPADGPRSF